ncbi:MAG: histidine phosphatase family protein [Pseudomonadota bacterium]
MLPVTRLLIARHGNTFDPSDTVLRVGLRTDLPLSRSGRKQAEALGQFFQDAGEDIHKVYTSELCRTFETANIALNNLGFKVPIVQDPMFNEVDYGVDDGQPEEEVVARIGIEALQEWEQEAKVPPGWQIEPKRIIQNWKTFAGNLLQDHYDQTVLVVTSNGIARFAPHLCADFAALKARHKLKLATGALGSFVHVDDQWNVEMWNVRPKS